MEQVLHDMAEDIGYVALMQWRIEKDGDTEDEWQKSVLPQKTTDDDGDDYWNLIQWC